MSENSFQWTEEIIRKRLAGGMGARREPESSPGLKGYREAAAVRSYFDPESLVPVGGDVSSDEGLRQLLRESSIVYNERGEAHWTLNEEVRRQTIREIGGKEGLLRALEASRDPSMDLVRDMTRLYAEDRAPALEHQSPEQLAATFQVISWYQGLLSNLPDPGEVSLCIEMENLLAPFRKLVGEHFRGREDELRRLRDYVGLAPPGSNLEAMRRAVRRVIDLKREPPLLVFGPGGIGKSTLLAKFILEHMELRGERGFPFAYLNFERSSVLQADRPITLVAEMLRQFAIQYSETTREAGTMRARWTDRLASELETRSHHLDLHQTVKGRPWLDQLTGRSPDEPSPHYRLATSFLSELQSLIRKTVDLTTRPFLLVLDTFEEVQYRNRDEISDLASLLQEFQSGLPELRTIVVGRAPVTRLVTERLELSALPREAATRMAEHLLSKVGREWTPLAEELVDRFGGNPLTIRLAVDAVAREGGLASLESLRTHRFVFFQAGERLIQGQLYRRILDHIHHPDVRRLARCGIALRRLTPELIREVLAEPSGVSPVDDSRARDLFEELSREASLVVAEPDGSLSYRPEIRGVILDLQRKEDPSLVENVHSRAVRFYRSRKSISDRAEEIYHRLALGQASRTVNRAWFEGAEEYLKHSFSELSIQGKAYLLSKVGSSSHLGITLTEEEEEEIERAADSEAWVGKMRTKIEALLPRGKWVEALRLLGQRADRGQDGWLLFYEALCLERTGRIARAHPIALRAIADASTASNREVLREALKLSARIDAQRDEIDGALESLKRAADLSRELSPPLEQLAIAVERVELLERSSRSEPVSMDELRGEIGRLLDGLAPSQLRGQVELTRRAMARVGAEYPRLWATALSVMPSLTVETQKRPSLGVALAQWDQAVSREKKSEPGLLAREFGLPGGDVPERAWTRFAEDASPARILKTLQTMARKHAVPADIAALLVAMIQRSANLDPA